MKPAAKPNRKEVHETLSIAWAAAERWRLELALESGALTTEQLDEEIAAEAAAASEAELAPADVAPRSEAGMMEEGVRISEWARGVLMIMLMGGALWLQFSMGEPCLDA